MLPSAQQVGLLGCSEINQCGHNAGRCLSHFAFKRRGFHRARVKIKDISERGGVERVLFGLNVGKGLLFRFEQSARMPRAVKNVHS